MTRIGATNSHARRNQGLSARRALLYGTLLVGIIDGMDAVVFFGLRGVRPLQVFQAIASGVLGRAAFAGGQATAWLGVALHFFIAFCVCLIYLLASSRVMVLRRAPVACGVLYGLAVYLVMNLIVVPASAAAPGTPSWPVVVNGILIHMLGVGLPAALVAAATRPPARGRAG